MRLDKPTSGEGHAGRFESNPDRRMAEFLNALVNDGSWTEEEYGSATEGAGWHGLLVTEQDTIPDTGLEELKGVILRAGVYVLHEDIQGFFAYEHFPLSARDKVTADFSKASHDYATEFGVAVEEDDE